MHLKPFKSRFVKKFVKLKGYPKFTQFGNFFRAREILRFFAELMSKTYWEHYSSYSIKVLV